MIASRLEGMVELQNQGTAPTANPGTTTTGALMAHDEYDEFPELTRSSKAVLKAATAMEYGEPERRVTAAVIREAVIQAAPYSVRGAGGIPIVKEVVKVKDLLDIADNLHSPPSLLTPNQMIATLNDLDARYSDRLGPEWASNPFEDLRRGIAHYCKEQP